VATPKVLKEQRCVASSFVSVIVPVFNSEHTVVPLLESLRNLEYPPELLEVIIVDNGSTDGTLALLEKSSFAVDTETRYRSSYAARNRGIGRARGDILAFTDADCTVDPHWVIEGVAALERENADLAGGDVQFLLSAPPRGAEAYDALVHMNNRILVARQGTAVTANLFVRRRVFDAMGLFPVRRSGGDGMFTGAAVRAGHRLIFAPDAIVHHPARRLGELLRKSWRVGTGYREKQRRAGRRAGESWRTIAAAWVPPTPNYIRRLIEERGTVSMMPLVTRIAAVAWLYGAVWSVSAALSLVHTTPALSTEEPPVCPPPHHPAQ
jgi:glycosyltransferase involved in cell wall biosynthesis